jgi:hypothetical protein
MVGKLFTIKGLLPSEENSFPLDLIIENHRFKACTFLNYERPSKEPLDYIGG